MMKYLNITLSILLFVQSNLIWANDAKVQSIQSALHKLSYQIDSKGLKGKKANILAAKTAKKLKKEGVKSKDMVDFISGKLPSKKSKKEFKDLVKVMNKQKLGQKEMFKRLGIFLSELKSKGARFGDDYDDFESDSNDDDWDDAPEEEYNQENGDYENEDLDEECDVFCPGDYSESESSDSTFILVGVLAFMVAGGLIAVMAFDKKDEQSK